MAEDQFHKQFDPTPIAEAKANGWEPVTFNIGDELFTCIPNDQLPSGALRRLSGGTAWTIEACCGFIEGVLEDKDLPKDETDTQIERFRSTLERKDLIVNGELLSDIVIWLMGACTERPTKSPSGSTGGRKPISTGSKEKPSGKAKASAA